jgi:hypothetical protein
MKLPDNWWNYIIYIYIIYKHVEFLELRPSTWNDENLLGIWLAGSTGNGSNGRRSWMDFTLW